MTVALNDQGVSRDTLAIVGHDSRSRALARRLIADRWYVADCAPDDLLALTSGFRIDMIVILGPIDERERARVMEHAAGATVISVKTAREVMRLVDERNDA